MKYGLSIRRLILAKLGQWLLFVISKSCRVSVSGEERLADFKSRHIPLIYIFWHRHIFFCIWQFRSTGIHPLVSLSDDGSLVTRIAEGFGMKPIRGSSSTGGARAFLELAKCLNEMQEDVLITADGPKGPARVLKDGVAKLAEKTGYPVVPISWYGSRMKIFEKSWDRFLLPLPFSRIHFAFGQPVSKADWLDPKDASCLEKAKTAWGESLDCLETTAMERVSRPAKKFHERQR